MARAQTTVLRGLLAAFALLLTAGGAWGQATAPTAVPREIFFSTRESFTPTVGPWAGQLISAGDLLSTRGRVVATNQQLLRKFMPQPPTADYGLDALDMLPTGGALFSVNKGFFDERLGVQVQPGDLLRTDGKIVARNSELLAGFSPTSTAIADYGLDAVDKVGPGEVLFSTNTSFTTAKGVTIGRGDVLSNKGYVVKTNEQLLQAFPPSPLEIPVLQDYGVDALQRLPSGEIWFSLETNYWGTGVTEGDLLSDTGKVVRTNAQLLAAFFGGADKVPGNFGLDDIALPLPGDVTADFRVDDFDLNTVLSSWGQIPSDAAVGEMSVAGGGEVVDDFDLNVLLSNWSPPEDINAPAVIPEPAALCVLLFGGLCIAQRRVR